MALRKLMRGRPAWLATALALVATVSAAAILTGTTAQADSGHERADELFEFETLAGLPAAFTGDQQPIRGVNGGGLPWIIDEGEVELESDGTLQVRVEGLVLAESEPVPEAVRGTNPVPQFRVVLSCLTPEGGLASPENVASEPFPASPEGDAQAEVQLELPDTCLAPIVFVTSPSLAWFAVSGFES